MTTISSTAISPGAASTMVVWINRALETLWLLTVVLVPLAFLDRDYVRSEAVISYVEVPKIALLRTLAGLIAILWLAEWGVKGFLANPVDLQRAGIVARSRTLLQGLPQWLADQPSRWLFLAVWFFLGTTLLSTALSGSLSVSVWGEVPGQDGYPAYTIIAYVLLFAVVATHLKTTAQLWRLLGAFVVMGVLISGYAILQHYGNDFLNLTETTGGGTRRVTSFMGNAIFSGAVMMMVIPMSLLAATLALRRVAQVGGRAGRWSASRLLPLGVVAFWGAALAVQFLGITFTFSRGPWAGMVVAVIGFLSLTTLFVGRRPLGQALLALIITVSFMMAVLMWQGSISFSGSGRWLAPLLALGGLTWTLAALAERPLIRRAALGLGMGAAIVFAVGLAMVWARGDVGAPPTAESPPATADATVAQVSARLTSIRGEVLGGLIGGRTNHWETSWRLIRDRPWFDFDDLSLGWARPIVGYGPDLFRYTYLLESRPEPGTLVPLEPDHAHNFLIHQTVEQGYLGLLSSLGIFAAVALGGGYQLFRRRESLSPIRILLLIALLGIFAGRFLEMMVGVARVSDLTILWVLLGVFAALPGITPSSQVAPQRASSTGNSSARTSRRRNQPRPSSGGQPVAYQWSLLVRLAIVAGLMGVIGVLTWVKSVDNVRAAVEAGDALAEFQRGDWQESLSSIDRAIQLAPDISHYYNNRADIYLAYQLNQGAVTEIGCNSQDRLPYQFCLAANSFQSNLDGASRRPFYYRAQLALANSAYNLPELADETVLFYQRALELVPGSWRIKNEVADAYLDAGQPVEALQTLEGSLAITEGDNKSGAALAIQGSAYLAQNNLEGSAKAFERSLELQPDGPLSILARQSLGDVYIRLGQYERALENLDEVVRLRPLDPESYSGRARSYLEQGQYEQAITDYSAAIRLNAFDAQGYFDRGMAYAELGQAEKEIEAQNELTVQTLQKAILLEPQQASAYASLGRIYAQLDDHEQSIQALNQAIVLDPQDAASFAFRGSTYGELGQHRRAIQDFNRAITLDPENSAFYVLRGNAYGELGLYSQANVEYSQAILLDATNGEAYYKRGENTRNNIGAEGRRAIQDLGEAIRFEPEFAPAYFQRGTVYTERNVFGLAIQHFTEAIRLDPQLTDAYIRRGNLHSELGELGLAINDYQEAVRLITRDIRGAEDWGRAYNELGAYERAIEDFEQAIRLNPEYELAHTRRSDIFGRLGLPEPPPESDIQQQIQELEQAAAQEPQNARLHSSLGEAYNDLGRYEEAIQVLGQAIALLQSNVESHTGQGYTLFLRGETGPALVQFTEAIRLNEQLFTAYERRATSFVQTRLATPAIEDYQAAVRVGFGFNRPPGNLSSIGGADGSLVEAIRGLEEAMGYGPQRGSMLATLAEAYVDRGQLEAGVQLFTESLRVDFINPEVYASLVTAYAGLDQVELAIVAGREALGQGLQDKEALTDLGRAYNDVNQPLVAIQYLNQAIREDPEFAEAYLSRGRSYAQLQDNPGQALSDFEEAVRLNPQLAAVLQEIRDVNSALGLEFAESGQHNAQQGSFSQALFDFGEAIRLNPQLATSLQPQINDVNSRWGIALTEEGRYPTAIQRFGKAIHSDPGFTAAYLNRGRVYAILENYPQAILDFDEAIRLDPDLAAAHVARDEALEILEALGYFGREQVYTRAIQRLDQAIREDPEFVQAYVDRGRLRAQHDSYSQALVNFDQAILRDPQLATILQPEINDINLRWGIAIFEEGRYPTAIQRFGKAIHSDPEFAEAYLNRGRVYVQLENYPQAILDFDEAIRLDPDLAAAHVARDAALEILEALGYFEQGQVYSRAVQRLDQAIRDDPEFAQAYLDRGRLHAQQDNYLLAISDLDEAIKINPEFGTRLQPEINDLNLRWGNALADAGHTPTAIQRFSKAIVRDPEFAEAYLNRGRLYALGEDYPKAILDFDEAIRLDPGLTDAHVARAAALEALGM
ncbi:MAG: hypothetical protein BZY88_00630 [SAR202 cluster bacterium Io17-Chloro-G9]|nr:MAG: hypothetical protein BZY88_00630 [SAR202 cluster bacterium Io17-Chloro-G9]